MARPKATRVCIVLQNIDLFLFTCMYVCLSAFTHVCRYIRGQKWPWIPRIPVIGGSESPDMDAGNQPRSSAGVTSASNCRAKPSTGAMSAPNR